MNIGFLGLGNMGEPIAANLLAAGHRLTVWNRTPSKTNALREHGATVAGSIADASRHEVVCTMVSDDRALSSILDGGLVDALPQDAVHVSLSTISPGLATAMNERHARHGQRYLSAPVFGRPDAAAARKLFVAVAGDTAVIERCKPVFEAIAQGTTTIGPEPAHANLVKVSGNFLVASVIEAVGEAVALVRQHGIDPQRYVDFLTATLFAAPVYKTYGAVIAASNFEPASGFRAPLALKDLNLVLAAGQEKNAPLPLVSLLRDHLLTIIQRYGAGADWSTLARLAAENAGVR